MGCQRFPPSSSRASRYLGRPPGKSPRRAVWIMLSSCPRTADQKSARRSRPPQGRRGPMVFVSMASTRRAGRDLRGLVQENLSTRWRCRRLRAYATDSDVDRALFGQETSTSRAASSVERVRKLVLEEGVSCEDVATAQMRQIQRLEPHVCSFMPSPLGTGGASLSEWVLEEARRVSTPARLVLAARSVQASAPPNKFCGPLRMASPRCSASSQGRASHLDR